jgi:uncharacterized membrane protein YuzA (DUF378 family)
VPAINNNLISKNMNKLNTLDWIALILLVVGGLNWLLVGLFSFDLVAYIFGYMTTLAKIIYVLVGLSAIYTLLMTGALRKKA